MRLTHEEITEIERLASLLATARVLRTRARLQDLTTVTEEQAGARLQRAEEALRAYLRSLKDDDGRINQLTADNQVLRELIQEAITVHERGAWIYKAQQVLRD